MTRKPLGAGNWKMNFDHLEATYFVQKLAWLLRDARSPMPHNGRARQVGTNSA